MVDLCDRCHELVGYPTGEDFGLRKNPIRSALIKCGQDLGATKCCVCNLILTLLIEYAPKWKSLNPPYLCNLEVDNAEGRLRRAQIYQFIDGYHTDDRKPYAADVALYGQPELPCCPYLPQAGDIQGHAASPECFDFLDSRLAECQNLHGSTCTADHPSLLPKRTLFVGTTERPALRLSQNESITDRYAALSYCWGSHQKYILNKAKVSNMTASLEWSQIPCTIQDAVIVTRRLGIEHLWVDAFCIIQDDLEDWKAEAAVMGSYYEDAFITIAATSSADSRDKFLTARDGDYLPKSISLIHCPHDPTCNVKTKPYRAPFRARDKSRLQARAWVFQEHVLSKRIAHFTSSGILWECRTAMVSEDGTAVSQDIQPTVHNDLSLTRLTLALQQEPLKTWDTMLSRYTARNLTFVTDKLPGIAGLAKKALLVVKSSYLIGLWEQHLLHSSLWLSRWIPKQESFERIPNVAIPGVPTWTWASIDGPIAHALTPFWERPDSQLDFVLTSNYESLAKIAHATSASQADNFLLDTGTKCIILTGQLLKMRLRSDNVLDRQSYELAPDVYDGLSISSDGDEMIEQENSNEDEVDVEDDIAFASPDDIAFDPDAVLCEVETPDGNFNTVTRSTSLDIAEERRQLDVSVISILLCKQYMTIATIEDMDEMQVTYHSVVLARSIDHPDKFIRIGLMRSETNSHVESSSSVTVSVV